MMVNNIYLIKDLARLTGYSVYTLKFYLKIGLIKEAGRSPETNFRIFNETTVDSLARIRVLQKEGRSLKEIKNELL
jgi:DNA-binding transcriptional MerR regulator